MSFILPLLLGSALYYQHTSSLIVSNNFRGYSLLKNILNRDVTSKSFVISAKTKEKKEENWDIEDKWATVNTEKDQEDEIEEILGILFCNIQILLLP